MNPDSPRSKSKSSISSISSESEYETDEEQKTHIKTGQNNIFYETAEELMKFASEQKKIKVQSEVSAIDENIILHDISLHKKGPLEDKIYSRNPIFINNIRRGNTVIEYYNKNEKDSLPTKIIIICKRGLQKFYDITSEFLEYTKAFNDKNNVKKLPFLTSFQKRMRDVIFKKLESLANQLSTKWENLYIAKIYKENGEHCQIGYNKLLDSWVIASKNVTILLRNKKDLSLYIKDRHYWPKIIAEQWFEFLDTLNAEKIEDLKNHLENYTLLGEHCGHPKHTHIIKYKVVEIIFYAIVPHQNIRACCLSPKESFEFFKKFGLKSSKIQIFDGFSNMNDFLEMMGKLLKEIELGTCQKEGEGSVIYVTYENNVLSMCKMKTYEYLILRNLREHLKKQVKSPKLIRLLKYKEEVDSIFESKKLEKSKYYYHELGKIAFEYIKENNTPFDKVYYNYVDLLKVFLKKLENFKEKTTNDLSIVFVVPPLFLGISTNKILKEHFKVEEILSAWNEKMPKKEDIAVYSLLNIPRFSAQFVENTFFVISDFSNKIVDKSVEYLEEVEKDGGLNQLNLSSFNKKTREQKSQIIQNLGKKIHVFEESLLNNKYPYFLIKSDDDLKTEEILIRINNFLAQFSSAPLALKKNRSSMSEINVILPFGICGMGKSYLCNFMDNLFKNSQKFKFEYLSIDKIRNEIQKKKFENSEENSRDFYQKTVKETSKSFFKELEDLLKNILSRENEKVILFIDKNHTLTILDKTLESIYQSLKSCETRFKIIALIPSNLTGKYFEINEHKYPFSEEFILVSLYRCMNRNNHETLDQDPIFRVKVFLKFLQIFRNVKLRNISEFDEFIEFPFIKEGEIPLEKCQMLLQLIKQALKDFHPKGDPIESPIHLEIVNEFYKVFNKELREYKKEEFEILIKSKFKF